MNRHAFLGSVAGLVGVPALAIGKGTVMQHTPLFADLKAKRPKVTRLAVRHVGAYVSTLTTITVDRLSRLKPLHETQNEAEITAAFSAIEAAEPVPSNESSEPRWHLTFSDESGSAILVVTSATTVPRHGYIDGHRVVYRTDRLVGWLTQHYAPEEASASH